MKKIILSVVDKDKIHPIESTEAPKFLEMNLNDSRFDPIRRNLNDFINDANSATTIFPRGSLRYAIFGDFSTCIDDFSSDYYGYVTFIDRHGKKSKILLFSPRLLMGYIEVGTTKNGNITYIERTINMGAFLLPHEIDVINDAFTTQIYLSY